MKMTNLNVFYHLGSALEDTREIATGMELADVWLKVNTPVLWLTAFLAETQGVPMLDSQKTARKLLDLLMGFLIPPHHMNRRVKDLEVAEIIYLRDEFEKQFEHDSRNLDVFTVLPKGIYNTRLLIETPENKFPEGVRKVFTEQTIYDLKEAGRCLAFELPTACAFHACRATEVLIIRYYQTIAGQPWAFPQRDWGTYIRELNKLPKVDQKITTRLSEIKTLERNPYTHPETNVEPDKATIVFELCTGVIHLMAEAIGEGKET